MALEFAEHLDLEPIPTAPGRAARQALILERRRVATGGIDQVHAEALAAIDATSADDEASELKRLRLLYREAYTRDELAGLVTAGFARLGFGGTGR